MRQFLITGLAAILLASCGETRSRSIFEIPEGYKGWVEVRFGRAECPTVLEGAAGRVFRIPRSGVLCTSSLRDTGVARDEYFYVGDGRKVIKESGWGEGGLIWGGVYAGRGGVGSKEPADTLRFFVGTEAEYKRATGQA